MSIGRSIAKGATWMVLLRFCNRTIGFVSTLILARLLLPADFGLVAIASAIVGMLELMGVVGLEMPLIQRIQISRRELDTAWTLQLIMSLVLAVVLTIVARPAAEFYGDPRLAPVCWVLGGTLVCSGVKNIGVVYFRRDLRFHMEFLQMGIPKLLAFAVTVVSALILRSYWALVVGILANRVMDVILSYRLQPYRPWFALSAWRELYSFSAWVYINNFLIFLNNRSPQFVLGKLGGAHDVGVFTISYELASLPTTEMVAPINRAVFPGYARMAEEPGALRRGYLAVAGIVALTALPAAVGIAVSAEVLVPVLLGARWIDAVPLVQMLALAGALSALQTNTGAVYMALGRPWIITVVLGTRISVLLLPALVYLSSRAGANGAAFAYLAVAAIMIPLGFTVVFRILDVSVHAYVREVYRPVIATAVMFGCIWFGLLPALGLPQAVPTLTDILAILATGVVVYVVIVLALWQVAGRPEGAERSVVVLLQDKWRQFSRRKSGGVAGGTVAELEDPM